MAVKRQIILCITALLLFLQFADAQQLVHPGVSHNQADLDRMKYMVESRLDPWFATYQKLKSDKTADYNYKVRGDASNTTITNHSEFIGDGIAAYHNALMWYITGDERHAKKCVEIFNAWANITRIENQFALDNGRGPWKMLEGAEIIKCTYDGWAESDIEKFKAMLVYPGWSGTKEPDIGSKNVSFYWNIYQGDKARHGNQGLYAYRSLMAMGIFLDNEIIYERALRYLQGLPHRPDDLPYPSGPPKTTPMDTGCEYYDEFKITGYGNEEDYGYNEVLEHYIWETGQSQESSRDQAHGLGGVSAISCLAEMAWTQGDDLYGHLDNRLLTGWEFYYRYNLAYENPFPDQLTPWEPTVETGEFIQRTDRSGRWKSLQVNPWLAASKDRFERGNKHMLEPVYEQSLGHYKGRLQLEPDAYKWLERGYEFMKSKIGWEDGRNNGDHAGYGGLKFHRVSPGDPIRGMNDGLPVFGIHTLPGIIEAEHYDHFAISGQDRTYRDSTEGNFGNVYREDDVDLWATPEGGYAIYQMDTGEWLTYTLYVPKTGDYDVKVRYMARNEGAIRFGIRNASITDNVTLPATAENSWSTYTVGKGVPLKQGVQSLKLAVTGASGAYVLDQIIIEEAKVDIAPVKQEEIVAETPEPAAAPIQTSQPHPVTVQGEPQPTHQLQTKKNPEQNWLLIAGLILTTGLVLGLLLRSLRKGK